MQLLGIAFAAWLISHLIKFSIDAFHGQPDLRSFYRSGGMPSAHTAAVTAAAVAALMLEGPESAVFGLAAVLAAIVVYDSLGMRRSVGEQAITINTLSESSSSGTSRIREVIGHTPREVIAGIGLGAAVALLFTYSVWSVHMEWLLATPGNEERLAYLIVFAALIAAGVILRIVLTRYRKVAITRQLVGQVWWSFILPGAVGLFFSLLQYQASGGPSGRLWTIIVASVIVLVHIWLYFRLYRKAGETYRQQVAERKKHRRKQRKHKTNKSKNTKKRK